MKPRLTRSKNKIIAGVCAGLANYFGLETSLMRVAFVLVAFITAFLPMIFIYLVMMFVIPVED